jgi:hypothetical protein
MGLDSRRIGTDYWALMIIAYAALIVGLFQERYIDAATVFTVLAAVGALCFEVEGWMKLTVWIGALVALLVSGVSFVTSMAEYTLALDDVFWEQAVKAVTMFGAAALIATLPGGLPGTGEGGSTGPNPVGDSPSVEED